MATKFKGKWRTQVLVSGPGEPRKYKSFFAETEDEADFLALKWKLEGKKDEKQKREQMTLSQAVEAYIDLRRPVLSPSTIRGYEKILRNNLGSLAERNISLIDYVDVQKAVNELCATHSVKTVKNALGLIIPTLRIFGKKEIKDIVLPREKKVEYKTPDGETLKEIYSAAVGTPLEVPILLASWLSLRMSEVLGLKWADVHEGYIEVTTALVYDGYSMVEKAPKTEASRRKVLCPNLLIEKINALPHRGDRIFQGWTTNKLSKAYARFLEKNQLPKSRFHDLRHANASAMLMLGIPDKYAMERGGWSSLSTMRDRYQQTFSNEQIAVANRIDEYFLSLMQH